MADFSFAIKNESKSLMAMANTFNWRPRIKSRINYIVDEMKQQTSFDCFKFIPDIDYIFIVSVSLLIDQLTDSSKPVPGWCGNGRVSSACCGKLHHQ